MENTTNVTSISGIPNLLLEQVQGWLVTGATILPNFIVAIILFFIFVKLARFVRVIIHRVLEKMHVSKTIRSLAALAAYVGIILLGITIVLGILNLDKTVTSLLAGLGLAGLALGYAFQDIIANFVSGILVSVQRIVKIGDVIEADGKTGKVVGLNLRVTTLDTPQGERIMIPNQKIFQNTLTNFSIDETRRIDIPLGVSYQDDLEKVEKVTIEVLEKIALRDTTKPAGFVYTGFGDSSIDFTCNFWLSTSDLGKSFEARSLAIKAIKKRFDAEGFDIPYPIRTVISKN